MFLSDFRLSMPAPMDNCKGIFIGKNFLYENENFRYGKGQKWEGLGSLTSCPGLRTAAAATVRNPWYGKPFHRFHLLLFFNVLPVSN